MRPRLPEIAPSHFEWFPSTLPSDRTDPNRFGGPSGDLGEMFSLHSSESKRKQTQANDFVAIKTTRPPTGLGCSVGAL